MKPIRGIYKYPNLDQFATKFETDYLTLCINEPSVTLKFEIAQYPDLYKICNKFFRI